MFRSLLSFTLLVFVLATYDPTYQTYSFFTPLKGPYGCNVSTYGNFPLEEPSLKGTIEFVEAQIALNTIMSYYYQEEFQRGPDYILEHYFDTSLSTTAYILYKKVNLTHTYRYFAIRTRRGKMNGTYFNLGNDTCQSCRPGMDMPLFKYQQIDISQNSNLVANFMSVINSAQISNLTKTAITQVKYWQFPRGNLYIVFQKLPNMAQMVTNILDITGQYMSFINSASIPHIQGNIPIDYVYVRNYIGWIMTTSRISIICNVIFFEHYLDEISRDSITFMVNFGMTNGRYTKIMGVQPTYYNNIRDNNDIEFAYQKNYTTLAQVPYLNISYFNNNQRDLRMGSTLSSSIEYSKMSIIATNGCQRKNITGFEDILNIFYIDFPTNQRLFNVHYKCGTRIWHTYFQMDKTSLERSLSTMFQRILVYNQSYNDNSDWRLAAQKIADYAFVYGKPFDSTLYRNTEYCSLYGDRFEIMVMHTTFNDSFNVLNTNQYCPRRAIFFKDLLTNRTQYIGATTTTSKDCDYQQRNYLVKSICQLINTANLDSDWLQKLYDSLKNQFRNTRGQVFTIEQVQDAINISTSNLGAKAPNLYYVSFLKSGVVSTYIITMGKDGVFRIFDYLEGSVQFPSLLGKKPQSFVNSTNSTNLRNSSNQTNQTNSSNTTSSSSTNQTNSTPTNSVPSIAPSSPATPSVPSIPSIPSIPSTSNTSNSSINNIPSSKNIVGNSNLTLAYIQSIYMNNLSTIISSKDPSFRQQNPIIHYFSDSYNQLISYAILFSYPPSIFVVYEILQLTSNNSFYYIGKSFIPTLPSAFWELQPIKSSELMQLTYKLINKTSALQVDLAKNVSMNGISFINGGYYLVDVQFASGTILHASFLRYNNAWVPVYGFLQPPTQDINRKLPSNNLPPLTLMTSDDVNNDKNIQQAFSQVSGKIQQMTQKDGYVLNKIERGTLANGILQYVLTYRNQMVTSFLIFQIAFDPTSRQIVSAQYIYQNQTQGTPPQVSSATVSQPNIQTLIQQKISEYSQFKHPQLKKSQYVAQITMDSLFYYAQVVYTTQSNCKFQQSVRMSIVDLKIEELGYVHM